MTNCRASLAVSLCLILVSAAIAGPTTEPIVQSLLNHRVLFLGDSITQDGQYVSFIQYYLERAYPDATVDVISVGLASETVSGLSEAAHPFPRPCVSTRLQSALTLTHPTTVVLCYGMNDGIYAPIDSARTAAFEKGITMVLQAVKQAGAKAIVCTPPPFDSAAAKATAAESDRDFSYKKPFVGYDHVLESFAAWESTLSPEDAEAVVDFHAPLRRELDRRRSLDPSFRFTRDGIHPDALGHLIMARTLLETVGFQLPPATDLNAELKRIESDEVFKQVRSQRVARSAGWLSYIGYTREKPVKTDDITLTEKANVEADRKIHQLIAATQPATRE